jgi:hypothetical protein
MIGIRKNRREIGTSCGNYRDKRRNSYGFFFNTWHFSGHIWNVPMIFERATHPRHETQHHSRAGRDWKDTSLRANISENTQTGTLLFET